MALEVCRICGDNKDLKNILEQGPELIEKLVKCANVHIFIEDLLPKLICQLCDEKLDLSYRLRKQSDATQRRLRREIRMKQTQEDGDQQNVLQNREDVDITNCLQSTIITSGIVSDATEDHHTETILDDEEFQTIDNIESRIISSEELAKDESSNSFKMFGSQKERTLLSTEQQPYLDTSENITNINPIIADELNNKLGPHSLTDEIIINGGNDDDDNDDNNKEKHVTNRASQNEAVIEHCSIDLVTSSDSTSDACEEDCTILQNNYNCSSYTCETCQQEFSTKAKYGEHIKQHGTLRFQCIQCCKFFPTRYRLARHEETHLEVPLIQCTYCERGYRAKYNLERHVQSAHTCSKKFKCDICNMSFSRVDVLKRHMQLHSDKKEYACTICSQSFKTKDHLYSHRKAQHPSESSECLKIPTKSRSKNKEKTNKYQCANCSKLFNSSFTYKNHLLIHTNEKPHECETCKKKFRTIAAVMTHQRIHSDYRPYQCDICLKSFKQTSHLKVHKMLHLDTAPQHICSICHTSFLKKGNLNAHMRTHTRYKPFKCASCSSAFAFMYLLKRHANLVHGRIVDDCDTTSENITEDTAEYEQYDYIDSVVENDDVVEVIEDNQVNSPSSSKLKQTNINTAYSLLSEDLANESSVVSIDEPVMTNKHIDTSNFVNSPTVESDFIENFTEEEFHITEQKIEVFVSEETKFTSFYNMEDVVQV